LDGSRLLGVLVTYRRPHELERTLAILAGQARLLDELVVTDNEPSPNNESLVRSSRSARSVRYLPMTENLGFPGGLAAGMASLLESAGDGDWIVVLDDDDPPPTADSFGDLLGFAEEMVARDPRTAAVGLRGARFDRRRGLLNRVSTSEIEVAVPVDCVAGNALPLYRVAPLRAVGTFTGPLFFSHEELDLGLRLERAGYTLYAHGSRWRERRDRNARPDVLESARLELLAPNWRTYYSLRNTIYILRGDGRSGVALRVTLGRGILKPLLHVPRAPRAALRAIALNLKACVDGWRGRLGRRVEPEVWKPRPKKLASTTPMERTSR
jgi:glycosyltransferase involved in cell wall biosynthesis